MKFALINPNWNFEGSIYFGCAEPHLPIGYAYAKALLERSGHEATIIDAQYENLSLLDIKALVLDYEPDFMVVTTAPNYLFWRCAPPEPHRPLQQPGGTQGSLRGGDPQGRRGHGRLVRPRGDPGLRVGARPGPGTQGVL